MLLQRVLGNIDRAMHSLIRSLRFHAVTSQERQSLQAGLPRVQQLLKAVAATGDCNIAGSQQQAITVHGILLQPLAITAGRAQQLLKARSGHRRLQQRKLTTSSQSQCDWQAHNNEAPLTMSLASPGENAGPRS